MKIGCECGAIIFDSTDGLPNKAHLIPDSLWFDVYDALDSEVVDPVATGSATAENGYMASRRILASRSRQAWQCGECGRLYIDGPDSQLHCFVPESLQTSRRILSGE